MRHCPICGKIIENGITGCAIMPECFDCHGGFPTYAKGTHRDVPVSWDELDALEDRCLGDWEE